jgi:uncharacterized protein
MKPEIVLGIKRLIGRREDLKVLKILWFGGEPSAALDIVCDIASFAKAHCAANQITLFSHMTSNGYRLAPDVFAALIELGISDFQITLDGPRQVHDISRRLANGRGTFAQIMANLTSMKDSTLPFNVTLRVHVSRTNLPVLPQFIRDLDEQFLIDARFSINIHPIEPLSSNRAMNEDALENSRAVQVTHDLNQLITHGSAKKVEYGHGSYVCYAAQPNSFVIRADGRVGKCTVALNSPKNDIGHIDTSGRLTISNEAHNRWLAGWRNLDDTFLACPAGQIP